jgi:hypothetical protein
MCLRPVLVDELIASVSGIGHVIREDAGHGGAWAHDRLAAEGRSRFCHRRAGLLAQGT